LQCKILTSLSLGIVLSTSLLQAQTGTLKQALKTNGQLIYQKQKNVQDFTQMFQEGEFYGRLRNNNFYFWYDKEQTDKNRQLVNAIGGSFVYRSAIYNGFDFVSGLYGSHAFFDETKLDSISALKPGKDTLSRFEYVNTGSKSLYAFAQANISYRFSKSKVTLGRQLVETFYTKSNDTKMIPNSFDGIVLASKDLQNTNVKLAYLAKEKLRDHKDAHAVFMVGDANSSQSIKPQWSEQDDSAMHKGLTYSALKTHGKKTDAPLIVLDAQNNSVKNLKINFASYVVPSLLSQAMGELNYKIPLHTFSITPGIRYIHQFDNGAGAVGGASITTRGLTGYKDAHSLNSDMIAARLVTKIKDYKINLAYTQVFDKADLVTPWRGFPTAGYTRSMGVYNWRANIKSYRIELVKGANSKGIYTKPFLQTSILYMDGDKKKNETDSILCYAGIVQNIPSMQELQYRVRLGWRDFIGDSSAIPSYLDARFELNYLF